MAALLFRRPVLRAGGVGLIYIYAVELEIGPAFLAVRIIVTDIGDFVLRDVEHGRLFCWRVGVVLILSSINGAHWRFPVPGLPGFFAVRPA